MKKTGYRPPIERLFYIANNLRAGHVLTCGKIARQFEVNRKTAERDIDFLRDRLRYEIEYFPAEHSYKLMASPKPIL